MANLPRAANCENAGEPKAFSSLNGKDYNHLGNRQDLVALEARLKRQSEDHRNSSAQAAPIQDFDITGAELAQSP